jgi:hypothetical protein
MLRGSAAAQIYLSSFPTGAGNTRHLLLAKLAVCDKRS